MPPTSFTICFPVRRVLLYGVIIVSMCLQAGVPMLYAGNTREHRSGGTTALPLWNDTAVTPSQLRSIASSLLPLGPAGCPDTLFLPSTGENRQFVYIDSAESVPVLVTMSLRQPLSNTQGSARAFELSAGYVLTSAPSLRMPPPPTAAPLLLQFPEFKYADRNVEESDVEDPFVSGAKIEMKISAYPGGMRLSTVEFVGTMLDERFDNVWKTGDLKRFEATSVRCRQRSVFRNASGTYFAIIAFDAGVIHDSDRCNVKPAMAAKGNKPPLLVRYLITLRSDADVEAKAEHILQSVLDRFDRGG